jgi:hypothetical protein
MPSSLTGHKREYSLYYRLEWAVTGESTGRVCSDRLSTMECTNRASIVNQSMHKAQLGSGGPRP